MNGSHETSSLPGVGVIVGVLWDGNESLPPRYSSSEAPATNMDQ